ncbi:MAG TPA: SMC-Scp complex subunit ScpB [Myxococcaceae bacterium]|nr:SMC-Scp complex subunit ScpB [Myxococcaceae bacterium]
MSTGEETDPKDQPGQQGTASSEASVQPDEAVAAGPDPVQAEAAPAPAEPPAEPAAAAVTSGGSADAGATAAPEAPAEPPKAAKQKRGKKAAQQFSEEEIAAVAEGPAVDAELDEMDAADIDEREPADFETPFDKLVQKSRKLSPERIRTVLASLLFVSDKPLSMEQLYDATGIDRELITKALQKLGGIYREGVSGIVLYEVADGWQFRTDPGSAEYVRRFLKVKPQRLTRAAVETLAIIAYRQPVTRPEIEDIRGVDSGAVVKALLDRRLIKIVGKKEEVGRPILYGTTKEFLEFFALKDLASLPTLREFHELSQEHQEIVEREVGEKPRPTGTVAELADPEFQKKLEESNQDSEAALAELEQAITHADQSSKATAAILGTQNKSPEGSSGEEGQKPV